MKLLSLKIQIFFFSNSNYLHIYKIIVYFCVSQYTYIFNLMQLFTLRIVIYIYIYIVCLDTETVDYLALNLSRAVRDSVWLKSSVCCTISETVFKYQKKINYLRKNQLINQILSAKKHMN